VKAFILCVYCIKLIINTTYMRESAEAEVVVKISSFFLFLLFYSFCKQLFLVFLSLFFFFFSGVTVGPACRPGVWVDVEV